MAYLKKYDYETRKIVIKRYMMNKKELVMGLIRQADHRSYERGCGD